MYDIEAHRKWESNVTLLRSAILSAEETLSLMKRGITLEDPEIMLEANKTLTNATTIIRDLLVKIAL